MTSPAVLAAHARCRPHSQRLHFEDPPQNACLVPAAAYQDVLLLRDEMAAYAARLRTNDLKAAASQWSKHYVAAVVPGIVALMTLEGLGVEASASSVRIEQKDGRPHAAWIHDPLLVAHQARALAPDLADVKRVGTADELHEWVLRGLFDWHMSPLFRALEAATGLWQGVAWSNLGNTLAWYYDRFAAQRPSEAREDRVALLDNPCSPTHDPVRYVDLAPHGMDRRVQVRRTCCLRYRLPDTGECYTCPRLTAAARTAVLGKLEAPR